MGYDAMEEAGVISPVISIHCEYKSMTRFRRDSQDYHKSERVQRHQDDH